jgi:membrane associated rhomboid family serine protease
MDYAACRRPHAFAVALIVLSLASEPVAGCKNIAPPSRDLLQNLRAGGSSSSSPYEFNPNYEPIPKQKTTSLVPSSKPRIPPPEIPDIYYKAESFSLSSHKESADLKSVRDSLFQYLSALHQKSPALWFLTMASPTVFLLWKIPLFQPLLQKHFVCSRRNVAAGRFSCLFLSEISHVSFMHLLLNLVTLHSFAPTISGALRTTTNWPLWHLMVGTALIASIGHLAFGKREGCIGMSDITLAFVAMYARIFPGIKLSIVIGGIFPVHMPA